MAKYYVVCGDIVRILAADSALNAAKLTLSDERLLEDVEVADTVIVSERGFRQKPDRECHVFSTLEIIKQNKPE